MVSTSLKRERHGFLAARHDDAGIAVGDLLHADGNRAQARAAELVESPGGLFLRHAAGHGRLTGRVLPLGCGEDLAENDLVDLRAVDLGAFESCLDGDGAKLMGRGVGEGPVKRANGGTRRSDDDDAVSGHSALLC
jgi:hypothetical protein